MVGLSEKSRDMALTRLTALQGEHAWQKKSWQQLVNLGLPNVHHEDWRYTPLEHFLGLSYQAPSLSLIDSCSIESLSMAFDCYRLVFLDGEYQEGLSDAIPSATTTPLSSLSSQQQKILNQSVNAEAFSLMTDAMASSGVVIEVASKVELEKPIYLFHLNSGNSAEVYSYRHHVDLASSASCHVYEHHISLKQGGGVSCSRVTMNVADNAKLTHLKLVEESQEQQHFGHNDVLVGRDGQVVSHTFLLEGQLVRNHTSARLEETGANININSLTLPKQDQVFDTRTYLKHQAAHCDSHQTHKIIAKDNGVGVFNGMIFVDKHAIKTNGQMDNHNLLLSGQAQVNSKPQLEIYADDVKCSHGATTGQIDNNQLFYLQARGIPLAQAEKMITFAFAGELTDAIDDSDVRHHIIRRIEQKLDLR